MSLMNGILSPPPISDPTTTTINLSSKRKREENIPDLENTTLPELSPEESQALITDLIDVLKANDATPSILTRSIPKSPLSDKPDSKRQKPEENPESRTSILSRLSSNVYKSVDEVLEDIDAAVHDMVYCLEPPNGIAKNQYTLMNRPLSELSLKFIAFSRRAHELVKREKASRKRSLTFNRGPSQISLNPGHELLASGNSSISDSKIVLTLLGNAPAPKQLFSSLQLPTKVTENKAEVTAPIREAGLPNGITASRVVPTQTSSLPDNKKHDQTLGDVFPIHASVTSLVPPNPSKKATTKSLTVGWYHPAYLDSVPKTPSYFNQGINSGLWIQYSNSLKPDKEKARKSEDVTVGLGSDHNSGNLSTMKPAISELGSAQIENLFKSAYSSFAPTRDDAAAIVPTGILDRLWWQEKGKSCFNRYIEDGKLIDKTTFKETKSVEEDDSDMKVFEKGLEELERDVIDPSLVSLESDSGKPVQEKDVEEILSGISELLETLKSFQRIRHVSLNTPSRATGLLSSPDTRNFGTIIKPSESEQATYEILKSQLTMMISTLPPYAVAKLHPDRLAELSISTKIEIRLNEYKGVMEEDESATRAKMAASLSSSSSSRANNQSINRGGGGGGGGGNSTSNSHYGSQFSISQPRSAMAQFYSPSQTPIRSSSSGIQRTSTVTPVPYQAQRTSSSGPYRPNTFGMSSYSHQSPRPAQQQFVTVGQQAQYTQTPSSQGYLRAPSQNYHQHSTQPVLQTATNVPRQPSPQKSIYSSQINATQPQSANPNSSPAMSQRSQNYLGSSTGQSSTSNNSTARSSSSLFSQLSTSLGAAQPYSTFMTHEQQQTMIQRQQAALASQHQGGHENIRSTAPTVVSSSKSQTNGTTVVPAG
ncbi:hypothetical protein K3495_g1835 [Podosphaera aphanis]|nr:hypothetical protein K3495_g1835 [Podosphaera aphanis]